MALKSLRSCLSGSRSSVTCRGGHKGMHEDMHKGMHKGVHRDIHDELHKDMHTHMHTANAVKGQREVLFYHLRVAADAGSKCVPAQAAPTLTQNSQSVQLPMHDTHMLVF